MTDDWQEACVTYNPCRHSGEPCAGRTRITAAQVVEAVAGGYAYDYTDPENFDLTRRQVLVCCAWAVDNGPPRNFKGKHRTRLNKIAKAWAPWLEEHFDALWSTKTDPDTIPYPPKVETA